MPDYELLIGDCLETLKTLPAQSINACVTSPPYFGLRDYGVEGQLGTEPTPDEFVDAIVRVFREVRRVLRDDGTVWLNLGDSYARTGGTDRKVSETAQVGSTRNTLKQMGDRSSSADSIGLKQKDLVGIPWRVAFALQADGWYLRQDIIWHKPNPMPESVRDRCTKAHEYVFLLSKGPRYYYDHDSAKEPSTGRAAGNSGHAKGARAYLEGDESHRTKGGLAGWDERQRSRRDSFKRDDSKRAQTIPGQGYGTHRADREESQWDTTMRNRRSVWTVSTRPYKGAHFATFPPDLIQPCIVAGCPVGGTVLDPFGGSGTTAGVAMAHDRNAVLCELSQDYGDLVPERVQWVLDYYARKKNAS